MCGHAQRARGSFAQLFAIKAGASGELTLPEGERANQGVAWSRTNSGPGIPSPVVLDGRLYVLEYSGGMLGCYDSQTGQRIYRERIPRLQQSAASLLACGSIIYALAEDGTMHQIKAGSKFEVCGTNKLDGMFWATPAIVGDAFLLRSADALYCVKKQ
jgi:outer membrane protein assembly factor BamB